MEIGVLLGLADRAGLSLQQVIAMTGNNAMARSSELDPREVMRRVVSAAGGSESAGLRLGGTEAAPGKVAGPLRQRAVPGGKAEPAQPAAVLGGAAGLGPTGEQSTVRAVGAVGPEVSTDPESSWMAQARAEHRRLAPQGQDKSDAEVALEVLVEEARAAGVDSAAALRAQAGPVKAVEQSRRWETVARRDKGKGKLVQESAERGETGASGAETWEASHALAAFTEALPKIPPTERGRWVGTPDWVDNKEGAVKVMTVVGLKAPLRVLIDGGSFYSMAGARLAAQLGLPVDSSGAACKVQTALGKVEPLGKGLTRDPVPIVLNAGTPAEITLYEHLAITESTGYDLLIGTGAAYPIRLSVDRWAERGTYRVDWRSQG